MKNSIEFSTEYEIHAFAQLIRSLNEAGVPYTLMKDENSIQVTISNGY
jgi:hypothetical protein